MAEVTERMVFEGAPWAEPKSDGQGTMTHSSPVLAGADEFWKRWKRFWRRMETADSVWRIKRLVRQIIGTELRYFPQLRISKEQYADWCFSPAHLLPDSVVYSIGVGDDVQFDLALIQQFGLCVHAFDPTPGAVDWVASRQLPNQFRFHALGIAAFDGMATFNPPVSEGDVCYTMLERSGGTVPSITAQVCRLQTVLERLGHDRIDLLKMDIEGAEYDVIQDLLMSGIPVAQLLVEFHHRFPGVGMHRTRQAVELLLDHGFRIFHISPSGREYSFVRVLGSGAINT
jgi:FkbM family methyltransferase